MSEIIRAGIESVGASQLESAKAVGLTRAQNLPLTSIFPSYPPSPPPPAPPIRGVRVRLTLPPMVGQFRLSDQRLVPAFDHCRERIHQARPGRQFRDL